MREIDGRRMRTRVKGLAAIRRRARALLIACHRYARCRATTDMERREVAKMIATLTALLDGTEMIVGDPGAAVVERVDGGAQ